MSLSSSFRKIGKRLAMTATLAVVASGLTFGFSSPVVAQGTAKNAVCEGINLGGGTCNSNGQPVTNVIGTVINILSLVAGIAAVIMIIVGGLRYITSGGDSSKVASAKTTIIYSIIGLIIVALAQFIVRYVLDEVK